MKSILFFHNTAMWYRIPFFKKLSEVYDIHFIFTDINLCKTEYGIKLDTNINGLEGVKYKISKNLFGGISLELIHQLLVNNYDLVVDSLESPLKTVSVFAISKIRQKPLIFWSEEWDWDRNKSLKNGIRSLFLSIIVSNSNAIIVPGTKHKKYFVSLGSASDNVFIMPNVSNISFQKKDLLLKENLRKNLDIENQKVILYVGRLIKRKGVNFLIQAFAKLRNEYDNVVLIIVGRGDERENLELLTRDLGLKSDVLFMGYVDDSLLPAYYLLCNFCVIPSITDGIGDPWVFILNEAMYFGKPVIATNAVGAAFDMIKNNENGFLVPEKDTDALYTAMKSIISNPKLEIEMGKKSKNIIEKQYVYDNMVNVFNEVVEWAPKIK